MSLGRQLNLRLTIWTIYFVDAAQQVN